MSPNPARTIVCGLLFAAALAAQNVTLQQKHFGGQSNGGYASVVAALGDLNLDGCSEIGTGSPNADPGGLSNAGLVQVHDGRTGALLWTLTGTAAGQHFGRSLSAAGDFNGDGRNDFVVGYNDGISPSYQGGVRVFSGVSGTQIVNFQDNQGFGYSVCHVGDSNGNGRHEIAVGRPFADTVAGVDSGAVIILERISFTTTVVNTIIGPGPGDAFGTAVASMGADLDGNGANEIVVGAPEYDSGTIILVTNAGLVRVIDPVTGNVIQSTSSITVDRRLGSVVAGGGDFDGDGTPDYAAGCNSHFFTVQSGATGATLFSSSSSALADGLGRALDFLGDQDGDGKDEIVVGMPLSDVALPNSGALTVHRGGTGAVYQTVFGLHTADTFGFGIACGDVDGDGREDLVVGTSAEDIGGLFPVTDAGSVSVLGFSSPAVTVAAGISASTARVAAAGDVDGDGIGDFIVGIPMLAPTTQVSDLVKLESGADFSSFVTINGTALNGWLGWALDGVGDLNGDGFGDFIVGDPGIPGQSDDNGRIRLYSGATGAEFIFLGHTGGAAGDRLGYAVAGMGDLNGDGVPDFVAGAPFDDIISIPIITDAGSIRAYSGATGGTLWTVNGSGGPFQFGAALARVGDLNGDGKDEVVVGRPQYALGDGQVQVRNGATGALIFSIDGSGGETLGSSVAGLGDVNGDGVPDFAAGGPLHDGLFGPSDIGIVRVFSGADGSPIHVLTGNEASARFGQSICSLGDIDGDGLCDFAAGAPGTTVGAAAMTGSVQIHSGATGDLLSTLFGTVPGDSFGHSIACPGDLDGDCRGDLVVATGDTAPGTDAHAQVFFVNGLRGLELYGQGTPGCDGLCCLSANEVPVVGNPDFRYLLHQGPALGTGTLIFSPLAARNDAGVDPFGIGLTFHLDLVSQPIYGAFTVVSDAVGFCSFPGPIPAIPTLAGFRFEAQCAWYFGACQPATFGYATTNGLEVTIQP